MTPRSPGRRAATLSVGLGVLAVAAWIFISRFTLLEHVQVPANLVPGTEASEAVWVAIFVLLGIAGASSGLVAVIRGHRWSRAGGLLGLLMSAFAIFIGTLPLWFSLPNLLGTGSFG